MRGSNVMFEKSPPIESISRSHQCELSYYRALSGLHFSCCDPEWVVRIPVTMVPGNCVLCHARSVNGAQSYPQYFNLEVIGSGTVVPFGVARTALYKATDPDILVNIYTSSLSYLVPGPSLIAGANSTNLQTPIPITVSASATLPGSNGCSRTVVGPSTTIRTQAPPVPRPRVSGPLAQQSLPHSGPRPPQLLRRAETARHCTGIAVAVVGMGRRPVRALEWRALYNPGTRSAFRRQPDPETDGWQARSDTRGRILVVRADSLSIWMFRSVFYFAGVFGLAKYTRTQPPRRC